MENTPFLAAIDLGSNSYRLEIGRHEDGAVQRVEYLKETVRQGGGLDEARNLTPEAMQRGWDCLARFGQRLAGFPSSRVRCVATQTLREARNASEFLARGEALLGFPIDVIDGREEARLSYQGVARLLPPSGERRLVVDVGGRSTEVVLGQGLQARALASYAVGTVAWAQQFFPTGEFTRAAFDRAQGAAMAVLAPALSATPRTAWDQAYGSAGTIGAVADVLAATGRDGSMVTRASLAWLQERLLDAGHADRLAMKGLKKKRRPIIGGGLSVLAAVFDVLRVDAMHAAQGGLRHGVLYELLAREQQGALTPAGARTSLVSG